MPHPNRSTLPYVITIAGTIEARCREVATALLCAEALSRVHADPVTVTGLGRATIATFKGGQRIE